MNEYRHQFVLAEIERFFIIFITFISYLQHVPINSRSAIQEPSSPTPVLFIQTLGLGIGQFRVDVEKSCPELTKTHRLSCAGLATSAAVKTPLDKG